MGKSRGFKRYDPCSREYVEWQQPHDWHGHGTGFKNGLTGMGPTQLVPALVGLPRFNKKEAKKIKRGISRGVTLLVLDAKTMGPDWDEIGPKVWI